MVCGVGCPLVKPKYCNSYLRFISLNQRCKQWTYLSTTHHSDMLGGWWQRLCLFAIYLASGRWKQWLRYKSILTDGHSDNGRKVYHYVIIYFDECYSFAVYLSFGLCKTHMCKCKLILHRFVWHDSRPTFSNFIYYEYALTCPWWKLFLSFSCLHLW